MTTRPLAADGGSPEHVRARAAVLRSFAARLSACSAIGLHRRAGDDVWRGPSATRCHDDLIALERELTRAAADLVDQSRLLERVADELELRRLAGGGHG